MLITPSSALLLLLQSVCSASYTLCDCALYVFWHSAAQLPRHSVSRSYTATIPEFRRRQKEYTSCRERERERYKYSISQLARYDAVPECKITARDLACRLIHSRYTYSRYIGLLLYLYVIFLRIRHVPARDVTMTSSHGLLMQAISGAERPRSKLLQFSALRDCPGRLLLQHCNSVVKILPMNIPSDRTACVYTGRQKNRWWFLSILLNFLLDVLLKCKPKGRLHQQNLIPYLVKSHLYLIVT